MRGFLRNQSQHFRHDFEKFGQQGAPVSDEQIQETLMQAGEVDLYSDLAQKLTSKVRLLVRRHQWRVQLKHAMILWMVLRMEPFRFASTSLANQWGTHPRVGIPQKINPV